MRNQSPGRVPTVALKGEPAGEEPSGSHELGGAREGGRERAFSQEPQEVQ